MFENCLNLYICKSALTFYCYFYSMRKFCLKTLSFFISISPLIILLWVKYYKIIIEYIVFFSLMLGFYILMMVIWFFYWKNTKKWSKIPFKITEIKSNNDQHILYFVTYIIPLLMIEWNMESFIQLLIILLFMFVLYYRSNIFYANPVLSLFWWNIFRATIKNSMAENEAIILTKKKFNELKNKEQKWLYIIDEEVVFIV